MTLTPAMVAATDFDEQHPDVRKALLANDVTVLSKEMAAVVRSSALLLSMQFRRLHTQNERPSASLIADWIVDQLPLDGEAMELLRVASKEGL